MAKPKVVVDYTYSNGNTADCVAGTLTTAVWDGTFAENTRNWETMWINGTYGNAIVLHGDTIDGEIKESNMRGLFIVYVVNGVKGEVINVSGAFVADNAEKAKMHTIRAGWCKNEDLDDLDFVVVRLGDVRPKERVKEVKVVQ